MEFICVTLKSSSVPARVSEAIVLRTYPLKEADLIVSFLTRDQGKLRGVAKRARRPKSVFGSGLERLSQVKLSYFQRENRELVNLDSCDLIHSQFGLLSSVEAGVALDFFAEFGARSRISACGRRDSPAFSRILPPAWLADPGWTTRAARNGPFTHATGRVWSATTAAKRWSWEILWNCAPHPGPSPKRCFASRSVKSRKPTGPRKPPMICGSLWCSSWRLTLNGDS
jgi:hypothetical protein